MLDDNNAAPSAEAAQETEVTSTPIPESMTDEQRSAWLETGEVPTPADGESAPPESAADEAETTLATDGEDRESQDPKPKKGAESRKPRLAAEIQDLLAKRAEARREYEAEVARLEAVKANKQAPSPSAPVAETGEAFTEPEPEPPNDDDFDDLESLRAAERDYERKARAWEARKAVFEDRQARQQQERKTQEAAAQKELAAAWANRVNQAKARHKDFEQVAFNKDLPLNAKAIDRIPKSQHGAEVLYYLGSKPEEAARIARLDPDETVLALADIERAIAGTLPKTKTVTGALPPPAEIGGNGKTPDDPVQAALTSGDFARYQELMNKRDAALLKGK